jgi:long-subunit fatty acid transport protein
MKKLAIGVALVLGGLSFTQAQNEFDVLRYSNIEYYGDARFNAMGGSFGALGANMSSISVNPGGIGVYKSSDISFTPAFHYNFSESKLDGNTIDDGKLNFHFSNIGLVVNFEGAGNWQSTSFGMGYNRTNNFNTSIAAKGETNLSSLTQFTDELNANGGTFDGDIEYNYPFSANLPYQTYLVNPISGDSLQYDNVFANSNNIEQFTTYETRGGTGEMFFAFGGNYADKLFLGASFGIPTVRYVYDRNYTETVAESDTVSEFKSFTMHDYVKTSGAGFNLKLGLIYKVNDWVRLGMAFHTPTLYALTDDYNSSIRSEMKDGTVYDYSTPAGKYNYMMTTPYRFISSAAFIVGSHGVVNVDYELVDYTTGRLKADNSYETDGYNFADENESVRNNFQLTQNVRVGTEWRLEPFRLRAGYRYQGDPLKNSFNVDNSSNTYSIGAGIKEDDYYFDIAYALKMQKSQTTIVENQADYASTDLRNHYITFTLGFRF